MLLLVCRRPYKQWCLENEPDTLMYAAGVATADVTKGDYDIKKGDYVGLIEAASGNGWKALSAHNQTPQHEELVAAMGAELKLTSPTQLVFRTGGALPGFMDRPTAAAQQQPVSPKL